MNCQKFRDRDSLKDIIEELRGKGKKVVFTNGCFDLIHIGHIRLLREAKGLGDILVVAINSDSSIKLIKGKGRPIIPQEERIEILSALEMVDYVTVFNEPDPFNIISSLLPDILVKGSDWPEDEIVGRDLIEARGGKVVRIPIVQGRSTSSIIHKILEIKEFSDGTATCPED
jgi:D-beta-D-heptose 7-phosphate kinase/D-beta-D-heptose 1-phosphate adenosyltransferase